MTTAELLTPAGLVLGEGPIRIDDHRYACVDIRRGLVCEGTLDGGFDVLHRFDDPVSAICLIDDGELLAATRNRLHVVGADDRSITLRPAADDIRLNDGKADPSGRFVAGTMADPPRAGAGTLWSFSAGSATPILDGVTISNGLCWNETGDTLYYVDTPTRRIDAFDYDLAAGTIDNRRTVAHIDDGLGDPDGMAIDTDGGLWVAMWGGGSVLRYQGGHVTDRVEIPTSFPTCPAFVGPDHSTLLVTTASEPDNASGAGDIYVAMPGATGGITPPASSAALFGPNHRGIV